MSSSIEENIELLEINSPTSSKSYIKNKLKITDNKVGSPTVSSPGHSDSKTNSSNLFITQGKPPLPKSRKLPPPTTIKKHKRKLSKTTTEVTLESQETFNGFKEKHDDLTESLYSSKSDTRSYREKFKERFESVKKQAGRSVSKAHTLKSSAENIKSIKKNLHLMKRENEGIESALQNYHKNKMQRDSETESVSTIEAYNFFCGDIDKKMENGEVEDSRDFNKSTDVLIKVIEKDDDLVKFVPGDNLYFNIKLSENELYWKPSRNRPKITEKIESEEPRLLANEGFFTEEKPKVSSSQLALLEQRLLNVNNKIWFNCEGELDLLPNLSIKSSYKPYLYKEINKNLETEYVTATQDAASFESILMPHLNILDISIMSLKFKHHPLYSPEHVLQQKLISLYDLYKQRWNGNKVERISKRLDALRKAKKNVEMMVNNNSEINLKKIENYMNNIKSLRELQYEEGKQNRQMLKSILKTWKNIKTIREANNYSNTAIKLHIRKEKCNYEQQKKDWDAKIEEVCKEIAFELDLKLQKKMLNYKRELENWKSEMENKEHTEEKEMPKKPRKSIDHEVIEQQVTERFKDCFKSPGEPNVYFNLSYENEISGKIENFKEKLRRNAVLTTKIYLRIVCNKMEVCKSKIIPLTDTFTCLIDESFSMQLSTIPEYFIIEIHEQPSTLLKRKLGEIKVMIPPKNAAMIQNKTLEEAFEKNEIVHYKHEGVGSGIEINNIFSESDESGKILYTNGIIICKTGWDTSTIDAHVFEETSAADVVQDLLKEDGTINIKKLIEWANENNPDPQDPKNSILYEYIRNYEDDIGIIQQSSKSYFRCNPDISPFEFCEPKVIEENLRFKILELRDRNEPEFVGMIIPNRLKEIPTNILAEYNRRCKEEGKSLTEDDFDYNEDEIDSKRIHGHKYLKQVYTKVFQKCRNAENNLVYEDVVNEKMLPHIENLTKNIISSILSWFQFQPTLNLLMAKPTQKTSVKLTDLNISVKIKIIVKSAMNVPLRNIIKSIKSISDDKYKEETTVKSFVIITYQNFSLQTAVVDGSNPTYNEELILPLEMANIDYLSPNSLSGSIVIRLFDEVTIATRNGTAKTRNWLGSIEIPVSAIAYNNKMEGLFKVRKPANLLGYEQEVDDDYSNTRASNVRLTTIRHTYLSLKLTLQPNVPKLTQSMDELETTELPYIKQHIINWNKTYNNVYPNRKFSAFAIDINGKTTCITRYIRPLEPPQLNSDRFDASAEQCARYVSMIPFTDSNKFYQNVWLSTEQLLKLMIGSVVDHAIALTCYLTSLDLEAWLLLGYGLPHGATAYVLVREYNRETQIPLHFIYDVATATKYDIMDVLCPLQKIFCIVNEHNVWGNVQRTDQIQLTRFDFMRRSDWLPLFANQISAPTNSVQQKLVYSITPDVKQLEMRIEKRIRKKISKLRKHERTMWNHQLCRAFKSTVIKNETGNILGRKNSELYPEIKSLTSTNFVNGYIISIPYTTVSAILATVVATGVHLYESVDTEFGLAIQIYPYPNHVLAVWICFGVVTDKRNL